MTPAAFSSDFDVLVAGGGVAGVAAAVASARAGRRTALIEKTILPGGLATSGLVVHFMAFCDGTGIPVGRGMVEEFFRLCSRYGPDRIAEDWRDPQRAARFRTHYSPAAFVLGLDEVLAEAGVEIWFDTLCCRPVMEGTRVAGIEVENKSGRGRLTARVVIDATGDADIASRAGVECMESDNVLSNWALDASLEAAAEAVKTGDGYELLQINKFNRDREYSRGISGRTVTEFVVESRRQLRAHYSALQAGKGRSALYPLALATQVNLRKTLGAVTRQPFSAGNAWVPQSGSIGLLVPAGGPGGTQLPVWEIPYGCLVPSGAEGLLVAGRAIGADTEAWELLRPIPPCITTGQAAGTAAALACATDTVPSGLNPAAVADALRAAGVACTFDDLYGPDWQGRADCSGAAKTT